MQSLKLLPLAFLLTTTPVFSNPTQFHALAVEGDESDNTDTTESTTAKDRHEEIKDKVTEFREAAKERQLAVLKELCSKMVDHRIRQLNALKTRVNNSDLSTAEKRDLVAEIDEKIAALNAIKARCAAATNVDELKEITKDIERKHHIFKSVLPRLHAQRFVDRAQAFLQRLENQTRMLQDKIDEAETAGCDVTDEEAALVEFQAALQEARDHLNKAKEIIASIKDDQDPGSKREELKAEMEAMRDALKKAHEAFKKVQAGLKDCREATKPEDETETEPSTP